MFKSKKEIMKKKIITLVGMAVLLFVMPVMMLNSNTVYAAPAKFADATVMTLGKQYTGTMLYSGTEKRYSFTINSSSKVSIYFTSQNDHLKFTLYDCNGTRIDGFYNELSGSRYSIEKIFYLKAGTYYLETISDYFTMNYGVKSVPFTLTVSATSSNESFLETQTVNDDSFTTANKIMYNKKYYGQFGYNDSYDTFIFTVPAKGQVFVDYSSDKSYAAYIIYDANCKEVQSFFLDNTTPSKKSYTLKKGTYYIMMDYGMMTGENQDIDDWGFYNFKLTYKPIIEKAKITKASRKKTSATIKTKKIKDITGYEIAYSTSKRFTKSTTKYVKTKSLSKTIKKLNKKKNYYVKVRGYLIYNNKTYYGSYSSQKTLKK